MRTFRSFRLCALLLGAAVLLCAARPSLSQQDRRSVARDALNRALLTLPKLQYPTDRSAFRRRIVINLTRLDPTAAAAQCEGMATATDVARANGAAARAIADADQAKALALIKTATDSLRDIRSDSQREAETGYLLAEMAGFSPSAALTAATEKGADVYRYVFSQVARSSPAAAATALKTSPPSATRDREIAQLLPALAARDLAAALALADQIGGFAAKSDALARLARSLPPSDALAIAPRIPDDAVRTQALMAAIVRLGAADRPGAAASAALTPSARDAVLLQRVISETDPNAAAALIGRMAFPESRRDALGVLVVSLAHGNPDGARRIAESAGDLPEWALPALCAALAQADLAAATARAEAIKEPMLRDHALAEIARTQIAQAPDVAEEMLFRVGDANARLDALRDLVISLAPRDAERARGLTGLAGSTSQIQTLLIGLARAVAPTDAQRAAEIAKSCRPSLERAELLLELAVAAHGSDPTGARELTAAAVGDSAAERVLAVRIARHDAAGGVALADAISDPFQRISALCEIAEALLGYSSGKMLPEGLVQRVVEPGSPVPIAPVASDHPQPVELIDARPERLRVRIPNADAAALYTVRYASEAGTFTWEDLRPAEDGTVELQDDQHLLISQRLGCHSAGTEMMAAFFDDLTKAEVEVKQRLPYGIPVASFGGPGRLSSAPTWLHRSSNGCFWIYQDQRPWKVTAYGPDFSYRFSLLFAEQVLALDTDASGNLYVLHEGNIISRFDRRGLNAAHWALPEGRGAGEVIHASSLAVDPASGAVFVSDDRLARVQRYDSAMRPHPLPFMPWGWIGREDLEYLEFGVYTAGQKYRLDRPQRLLVGPDGLLYVDCESFIARFSLATGRQVPFGVNDVLGWGGTFMDSPHTTQAANDSHWQSHRLAGVAPDGTVYISDTRNAYLRDLRLQAFASDGSFIARYDAQTDLHDAEGARVYIVPPLALAASADGGVPRLWLADGGARVYEGPGIASGGRLALGPGIAGRQLDLRLAHPGHFSVEKQAAPSVRRARGTVVTFGSPRRGTRNCENERNSVIADGATSIWIPTRLGRPFTVTLLEEGRTVPAADYLVEIETQPGPFGTRYDFFRVTNKSGHVWKDVQWAAEPVQ